MANDAIPLQESFFYHALFQRDMDTTLLQSLISQKRQMPYGTKKIPRETIQIARLTLNHIHGSTVTLEDAIARVHFLKERFVTFKEVANFTGANWDYTNNYIHADESVWASIFEQFPLARAYRYKSEPEFHNLAIIFGGHDVKVEGAKPPNNTNCAVCIVNSNSSVHPHSAADRTAILEEDDEVTSPVLKPARRKLKFGEGQSSEVADELSQTNEDDDCRVICDPSYPEKNAFPKKPHFNAGVRHKHGSSSSCASSSPQSFNWGPFR